MPPIRIALADDHRIVLDGLQEILEEDPDIAVVGRADNARTLWSVLPVAAPDLLLLDLNMPGKDGLQLLPELKDRFPALKILVLTMYDSPEIVKRAFAAGADGYLLKDHGREELFAAIRAVAAGHRYLGKRLHAGGAPHPLFKDSFEINATLTVREKEVLRLIARSFTNKEIADQLFISEYTVATHRRNLKRKLGAKNTAELIRFAYERALL